ncbi:MAG TPA: polyhydroxyalkanoate synthesis regulator DNA-binding domain-containing protein [Roseiflexaceae bacterium]|nr:polyhydroxyalkanoate synthesis regulator DNA-binding domain-containing protein [Roseiflexaceae bacterium]
MQTIKKYANRKLYHVDRKQYITLEGIAALIRAGEQVQVMENETGADITAPILAQVALQARGERGWLPANVLAGLIRTGGDTLAGVQRSLWGALGGMAFVDAEIARRLEHLREIGALTAEEEERMRRLLLSQGGAEAAPELPSRGDVDRLRAEVDALAEAIDRLVAERRQYDG